MNPAIESLRRLHERAAESERRQAETQEALSEFGLNDNPSDKLIQNLLICRERAAILKSHAAALAPEIEQQKKAVVSLSHEALELFRDTAGPQLFERAEADLKASLPERITSDSHLLFKIWNDGVEKRGIKEFLYPPLLSPNHDTVEILEESRRIAQQLDDLIQGREVSPAQTASA